ncbi:heat shock factor-binding protein-like [Magnolia sinica]|uniref:heat shock factor-binding protein-like n=1 Tax=Magnolia sinica TaxID=86752 RepID=UPI0026580B84|nr:heat shock factor-binding protein-like [Magnolia sinica]
MDGQESDDQKQSTADMTAFVQNLLMQMQSRFQAMSESIVSKIDEMGTRIDELEQSINDLKTEMGADSSSPLAPAKTKPEETKPTDGST